MSERPDLRSLMPTMAILKYELGGLLASWLVRLWFIAAAVLTLLILATTWGVHETPRLIAMLQAPFLVVPWFLVVVVLGISPVTGSRLDALADGILSRPITRHEYLVASWLARVVIVLAVFLILIVPASLLAVFAERPVPEDSITLYGVCASFALVCLVLTFLVSLGFLLGTLLRRPMLAAVLLISIWLPINFVFNKFSLPEFSPIALNAAMPTVMQTPWREESTEGTPDAHADQAKALAESAAFLEKMLTGRSTQPARQEDDDFFNRRDFSDSSVPRIWLGYGVPTLIALGLAVLVFNRRDL